MALEDGVLDRAITGLTSGDPTEREQAIELLRDCSDEDAVAALVSAIEDSDKGVRERVAEALISRRSPHAPQFLCQYLSSPEISQRNLASEVLAAFGVAAIPALLDCIESDDHDVRKFAVDTLGVIGDSSAVTALIDRLDDGNENVVCSAAEALGRVGDSVAVTPLIQAYDRHPYARPQVVEALGVIADHKALSLLIRALRSDDPVLVFTAVEAMGNLRTRAVEPFLREQLASTNEALHEAVVSALIKVAHATDHSILDNLPAAQLQQCLIKAIRTGDRETKLFALEELRSWDAPASVSVLLDALNDADEEVAERAKDLLSKAAIAATDKIADALRKASPAISCHLLDTIAATGNSRFVPEVARLKDHADDAVRERVALVLGRIGDRDILELLVQLSEDPVYHVRSAALKAIGWIGAETVIDRVFAALDDEYSDVQQAALGALVLSGGPAAIDRFRNGLEAADSRRQILAAQALGWIGEMAVIEPLLDALNHPEAQVRKSAVESLGRIADATVVPQIRVLLNDEEPDVRKAAIDSIIALTGNESWKVIVTMLDDEDVWVRFHAINGLGRIANPATLEELLPFLGCENDVLRVAAAKALARLHDKRALPFLKGSVRDKNPDVVGAVSRAIDELEALADGTT
ncbi:MAG: HEAT repeat domain-containing protein [candidate division Zixibacteria bacterium]|nr:HEAT repeat domain-containing protein [candidate division Zixibacteria bacterium]